MKEQLNELVLFAGAGGGVLGGKLLGWRTRCAVEIDPYCRSVLLARQRDGMLDKFPIWDDIRTFDGNRWRRHIDVVSGGFPCQDISAAGKGAGIGGSKSGLWKHMARIIGEVQPQYVLVENSPLLVARGLDVVLADLAALGLNAQWGVIGAGDAGGLHQRNRIWIIAYTNGGQKRIQRFSKKPIQGKQAFSWCKDVRGLEDLRNRSDIPQPPLCRSYHGFPRGVDRIKALGNAQVPAVVKLAWNTLTNQIKN